MPSVEEVIEALNSGGIPFERESRDGFERLVPENLDGVVNVYDNGTCQVQGRQKDEIAAVLGDLVGRARGRRKLLRGPQPAAKEATGEAPKVFVVYGHDEQARTETDAMLRRWGLEPLILDHLPSKGTTLIEKLEHYQEGVGWALVLLTPDDLGHPALEPTKAAPRVRQNVVLEMGMLLGSLGRERVAMIYKKSEPPMELPSDMQGYIYIPYKNSVTEATATLVREMAAAGFYEVPATKM